MGMFNNEIKKKEVIKKTPTFYLNYRRVTTQSGLTQWIKTSGYGFSSDEYFASEGSGAVRVDFDCTLILHAEAIKQKAGVASLKVKFVKNGSGEVHPGVVSYMKTQEKRGI